VGHKNAGLLEHLKLWNVGSEQEIPRDCAESGCIDAFSMGQDNLPGLFVKGAKAELEEIWPVVKGVGPLDKPARQSLLYLLLIYPR